MLDLRTETTFSVVRFHVQGRHRWPRAPEHRKYLSHEHRHLFHVECGVQVKHDDREIEFHDLLDVAQKHFALVGEMSCEMAAKQLLERLKLRYPERAIYTQVFEDGECGARVFRGV